MRPPQQGHGGRAALLDRRHDLGLPQAHMAGIGTPRGSPIAMKRCLRPPASGGAR
jgi:hypothetical protein